MPASSLLALIDDIASVMDDVALMTKVAAKKTSGVLGDDLALNAEQVSGVRAEREIPIVLAVAKGSFLNKIILVPAALLLTVFAPWLVGPALLLGGLYLCFEGAEKVFEKIFHRHSADENAAQTSSLNSSLSEADFAKLETEKIKGAVRTDFILSAEIIVIALGTVAEAPLFQKALVLSVVALAMTVGVYGLVAIIVKIDDFGLYLCRAGTTNWKTILGKALLSFAPRLMKSLGVIGTVAMFLVGGGILSHQVPWFHELQSQVSPNLSFLFDLFVGLGAGCLILVFMKGFKKLRKS